MYLHFHHHQCQRLRYLSVKVYCFCKRLESYDDIELSNVKAVAFGSVLSV